MKSLNIVIIFTLLISIFPTPSQANIELEVESKKNMQVPFENGIQLRKLDLQNKLFREKVEDHRADFKKAKEAFKNSTSDTRNIMRAEFRSKFYERFKFTYDKLSEFQEKVESRISVEENNGVDTAEATVKLEESKLFLVEVNRDVESLKSLMNERYAEEERDVKKEQAKVLVEKIKNGIKSSHIAIKESVKELRTAMSNGSEAEASLSTE